MDVIEKAGTVYEDGSVERCVGFVFSKRVDCCEAFEPQVRQAMREYLDRPAGEYDVGEYVASNGVTVSLVMFDAERPVAPEEAAGFYVIAEEDWPLADAELAEIENAKPNPRKTA
jgi:hypothetical protein